EQRGKRVAQITRRIQRLGERCSFDVSKEIEEVGIAYHQELAMGCSHDVFNLAKSVRFSLRELRKELERRKVPRKVWEDVLGQGIRRLEVTEGIALSMRSFAKQCIPAVRRIGLLRALDEALGVVRDRCSERGHAAQVETIVRVPKHLRVEVPRDRLVQALINLLQNAFEAIKEQGVVWVEGELVDDHVALTIADTGRGIREELQQVVFFPGQSTKKGRRGHEHNTGWGLSLARKFVEQDCRGGLTLTSEYRKGTTVTLRLPLRRPEGEE
ncbi:MAG: sensor histidine kinase, partial [Myxococcales bacterium]|nr:sensor histidine kinase [Myxococcales bacterium]